MHLLEYILHVFVDYLHMQELFVDKIHFFKFLSRSDKARLDQQIIITATRSTRFFESFHPYKEGKIPRRKVEYAVLKKYEVFPGYQSR